MSDPTSYYTMVIKVRADIPDALRDALLSQLAPRVSPIVGNLADAQRGAVT